MVNLDNAEVASKRGPKTLGGYVNESDSVVDPQTGHVGGLGSRVMDGLREFPLLLLQGSFTSIRLPTPGAFEPRDQVDHADHRVHDDDSEQQGLVFLSLQVNSFAPHQADSGVDRRHQGTQARFNRTEEKTTANMASAG